MSLTDLFTGRLTWLELGVLVEQLPPHSAFLTKIRDQYTDEELAEASAENERHGVWSHSDMLLAAVVDCVQQLAHIQLARGGVQQDPPPPVKRPGVVSKRKASPQTVAYLDSIRKRHAEAKAREGGTQ